MKLKLLLFLWVVLCLDVYGQEVKPNKLDRAYHLYYKALHFQNKQRTDSANTYFLQAAPEFAKRGRYTLHAVCLSNLAKNYFEKGNYEPAKFFIDSVLATIERRKLAKVGMSMRPLALDLSADAYLWKSKIVEKLHLYDLAMQYANKAVNLRLQVDKSKPSWKKLADAYLNEGKILLASGYYYQAAESMDRTLKILQKNKSKDAVTLASIIQTLADNYQKIGDYEKALEYLRKATQYSKDSAIVALNWHITGLIADAKGEYDSAVVYQEKALNFWCKDSLNNLSHIVKANLNIGISKQKSGLFDAALEYEQKALQTLEDVPSEQYAAVLDQMGVTYASKGDIDQAIHYQEKALAIRQEKLHANHPERAENLLHLGDTHFTKKEYEKAKKYYEEALSIAQKSLKENHPTTASIYSSLGSLLKEIGQDSLAKERLLKALAIYSNVLKSNEHPYIGKIYSQLGALAQKAHNWELAIDYTLKSIKVYEKVLGKKHPAVAEDYYNLSRIREQMNQDMEALHYLQKAMTALIPDFEDTNFLNLPSIEKTLSEPLLLKVLDSKARLLKKCAVPNETKVNCLNHALAHYELATDLIEKMRNSYKSEGSKILLAEYTVPIYEEGIKLCLQLSNLLNDKRFYQEAFVFSEKSKAGVLRSAIADVQARKIAGIPDSLLSKEYELREELHRLDKALTKEEVSKENADKHRLKVLKARIFEYKTKYDQLIAHLEKTYPKYYDLKYRVNDVDFHELENALKKDKRKDKLTLVEYFVGNESIYIFTLSEKGYHVTQLTKEPTFEKDLRAFRGSLYYKLEKPAYDYGIKLYKKLIEPIENLIVGKNLLIIPDAVLGIVSLEALIDAKKLEKKNIAKDNFTEMPYLLKKYNFAYSYSSLLLLNKPEQTKTPQHDYLAFAPIFKNRTRNLLATQISAKKSTKQVSESDLEVLPIDVSENARRDYQEEFLNPLPATEQEVDEIAQLFEKSKREIFKGEKATEGALKRLDLKDYKYIHFATHGFVNTQNPSLSGIILYKQNNDKEDGILHSSEVYNLQLNADLVVLSACETGLGKVIKGEGIVGLARSFLYAGAKNIMVSLWKVTDTATKELVVDFYTQLVRHNKMSKSEALRRAKLRLLKDKKYAMPYYWNGFVLVGNSL
jgi:CHAT domain-containing protein/tetratricopeptide (TPR) repeat protein